MKKCLVHGGFFHDMTHSGINPYLTLHLAQVLLRAGDPRYFSLMTAVAKLASPTGQWPESVHPRTGGGCMGDGQHVWAAAKIDPKTQHIKFKLTIPPNIKELPKLEAELIRS